MFGDVPSSTSLLLQCGYRSKTCANTRATKLDGTLHRLCEFHRRKANENQQRLHQRHREERLKCRRAEAAQSRPVKRARLTVVDSIVIDPIPFNTSNAPLRLESGTTKLDPITFGVAERAPSSITLEDLQRY